MSGSTNPGGVAGTSQSTFKIADTLETGDVVTGLQAGQTTNFPATLIVGYVQNSLTDWLNTTVAAMITAQVAAAIAAIAPAQSKHITSDSVIITSDSIAVTSDAY